MAVRYVEIGQYPDVRREVRGNLSEILVSTANPGTYAAPEDVTGCFLEMGADGKWDGASVGTMSKATADALYASGALANLATGVTYREPINGTQYTYDGEEVGWSLMDLIVGPFANITEANAWAAANPSSLFLGLLATSNGQQIKWGGVGVGWVAVRGSTRIGRVAIFGNSIIEQNGGRQVQGVLDSYSSAGFCVVAAVLSGSAVSIDENWGIGGQTSADLLARVSQVTTSDCDTVVVMEVTNDASLGVPASDVWPNYVGIINAIIGSGKTCVMCTGIPRASATEQRLRFYEDINTLIMGHNAIGYIPCDTSSSIIDNPTGLAISGTLKDTLHPNSYGALLMAAPLAAIFNENAANRNLINTAQRSSRNFLNNHLMSGSGTSAPTGWSEQTHPSSWGYIDRDDGLSGACAVATVASGGAMILTQTIQETSLRIGSIVRAYFKINASSLDPNPGQNTQYIRVYFYFYNGSVITKIVDALFWSTASTYTNQPLNGDLFFRTPAEIVPPGTTFTRIVIDVGGGGTYVLKQAALISE